MRYEDVYQDIARQLFPHGLPGWVNEDGRRRAHSQIAEITRRAMREVGRSDGDPLASEVDSLLRITEIPHSRSPKVPRGRAAWRALSELTRLSSGDLLIEEFGDGNRLIAGRAAAPDPDTAHEYPALLATLVAEGAAATVVALIDGDWPSGTGYRNDDARSVRIAASPVGKCSARVRAEPAAPDGPEPLLAHWAGHRDAIVTRRRFGLFKVRHRATARRVASARARWLRIR